MQGEQSFDVLTEEDLHCGRYDNVDGMNSMGYPHARQAGKYFGRQQLSLRRDHGEFLKRRDLADRYLPVNGRTGRDRRNAQRHSRL